MRTCAARGEVNPERARFCLSCGTSLGTASAYAHETLKTVTILFCDVVGSTAVAERLDPESVRTLMSMFFFAARSALEAQGGTVEKFVGDAVLAAFGVPTLHEDDAVRAVRAALDVRAAVNELNARFEQSWGVRIGVRIGVNTGEVVAGDPALRQSFVSGDAVNVAARLEQAAGAGEILIGVETQRLTGAAVRMEQIAPLALRGKSGDVRAWRVLGPAVLVQDTPRRPPAPMVGRQRELARLQAAFEQTEEQRHCRLVTVIGSPGIGKSTLVEAFLGWAAGRATALGGRCLPYGEGITFWPIAEVVRVAARLDPQDGAEAASAKLTVLLAAVKDAGAALDAVVGLLGLGAATAREETFWAFL
jgi:class 3 adenylate cyclase